MMTPKSLVYVVLAVAVGYMLVSAVPQQVAMYTTPPQMLERNPLVLGANQTEGADTGILGTPENSSEMKALGVGDDVIHPSFIESTRLPELMKWWTVDILVALTIYWVAKNRLT